MMKRNKYDANDAVEIGVRHHYPAQAINAARSKAD
jgi:hypothetical protein